MSSVDVLTNYSKRVDCKSPCFRPRPKHRQSKRRLGYHDFFPCIHVLFITHLIIYEYRVNVNKGREETSFLRGSKYNL